jgi:hypothetical protein
LKAWTVFESCLDLISASPFQRSSLLLLTSSRRREPSSLRALSSVSLYQLFI